MSIKLARTIAAVIVSLVAAMPAASWAAEGDTPFDDRYTRYCFNCHAADPSGFPYPRFVPPKIAGQDAAYVLAAIVKFREGRRNHYLMNSTAEMIPSEALSGVAAYISSLDGTDLPSYATGAPDASVVSRGAAVAETTCFKCHGADGRKSKQGMPILDGQHVSYLLASMRNYRLGVRNDKRMYEVAAGLSLEDTRAVAAYYASLAGLHP